MRFFEPSVQWVEWLVGYAAGRIILDVGCGDGHIIEMVMSYGGKACGIDPAFEYDDPFFASLISRRPAEANSMLTSLRNGLVLFCRPCHSGFVEKTISGVHESCEIFYISKPENLSVDLPNYGVDVVQCPELPCERVYRVLRGYDGKKY